MNGLDKKNQKRENLMESGLKLFTNRGVQLTSIDDIVKSAGIAKGTFYLYFKDKYDLLEKIVLKKGAQIIKDALARTQQRMEQEALSQEEGTLFFISCIIDYLAAHKSLMRLLYKNMSPGIFFADTFEDTEIQQALDSVLAFLVQKGGTLEQARQALYIVVDMVGAVCCDSILYERPYSLEEIKPMLYFMIMKLIYMESNEGELNSLEKGRGELLD